MTSGLHIRDEPLAASHRTSKFTCGTALLDDHLKLRALPLSAVGCSQTLVAVEPDHPREVLGFVTLVPCILSLSPTLVSARTPVVRVTHLAVTAALQGLGVGSALVFAAALRAITLAAEGKAVALLVEASTEQWRASLQHRFAATPLRDQPATLVLPLATVVTALASV